LDGTIDLSPFTQPSSIIIDVGTDPHLCDSYNPYVIFPESSRLESLLIHGNVEHDRKTLPLLPNLKSITYHSLRETDLSWLNSSKSITHIRIVRWVPENVILPSISSLESISFVGWRKRDPTTLKSIDLSPLRTSKGIRKIIFSKQGISEVDFSPLSECSRLEHIKFDECNITKANLTPLEHMYLKEISLSDNKIHEIAFPRELKCEYFDVSRNELQRINLSRFSSSVLRDLNLGANPLVDIDLTPLSACVNLEKLEMEHTQLDSIDLTPLAGLEHLSVFRIKSRFMSEIDVTPLLSCPTLDEVKLGKIKPIADKKMIDEILSPKLKKIKKKIDWY
jgi:Leucine-rich repeat (LRR) protein